MCDPVLKQRLPCLACSYIGPACLPAGITAEGDNRVLFQKVTKELTAATHTPAVRARLAAGAARPPTVTAGVRGEDGHPAAVQHC
jgi:hypothetical protein